jgi:hypothetical protein
MDIYNHGTLHAVEGRFISDSLFIRCGFDICDIDSRLIPESYFWFRRLKSKLWCSVLGVLFLLLLLPSGTALVDVSF